jgi:hypothetical protein
MHLRTSHAPQWRNWITRIAVLCSFSILAASALAQGGPPMVTDDPETPGDGHWEINLGAIGARTPGLWTIAAPDADINYGWGDHIQLKADVQWTTVKEDGQASRSGVGDADLGLKWRFIDKEQAGFAMSIYPQYTRSVLDSSARRGIASKGHQFFMPVEFATEIGDFGVAAEVGRNFVSEGGPNQWTAGIVAGHACGAERECMLEVRQSTAPGQHLTLLNAGLHWKIDESLTFLGAIGHEFGSHTDQRRESLVYLGLQITR